MTRWHDDISLFINATPDDGIGHYDIWHNGGPGGPMLTAQSREAAEEICTAVDELLELRAEVERLRGERAAVVAWLREVSETMSHYGDRCCGRVADLADSIERGEHRHEEE